MEKIFHPTRNANSGGDAMVRFWKSQNRGKLHLVHLIQISCSYCIQAADAKGKQNLVKSYLMDAHLYLGMAKAGMTSGPQVEHLRNIVAKEALEINARRSATVNVTPWRNAKAEAIRLIRVLAGNGNHWATPSEAARVISGEVEKFLATQEPRKRFQGPNQRDLKIANWLREMPEASQLFDSLDKEK